MTARQPRRTRRRVAPASALPRPIAGDDAAQAALRSGGVRRGTPSLHHREHHVTKDYTHVKRDLATMTVIAVAVLGFIFGMSFVIQ